MKRKSVYIIAEAGVNHNGRLDLALLLIKQAKEAGADCIKFQTFKADRIVTQSSPKANYQLKVTDKSESQYSMLKKLELNFDDYKTLMAYSNEIGIDFLSTPYNNEDIDFLEQLGVSGYKVASGQLTELPFLKYIGRTQKKIFLSTGMGTLAEVFEAVETIRSTGNNNIVVLQCTTNYPSAIEDANVLAMNTMKEACCVSVGYSDHVQQNFACFTAVALGAEIIEKHFTLDKNMDGPDHSSSLDPLEFKELVRGIKAIEISLGSKLKKPSKSEIENIYGMKRSLVVLKDVEEGELITYEIIGFKRPANGLPPKMLEVVIGKRFSKKMKKDEAIQLDSVIW